MIWKMILKSFDFQCDFDFQITTSKMILINHQHMMICPSLGVRMVKPSCKRLLFILKEYCGQNVAFADNITSACLSFNSWCSTYLWQLILDTYIYIYIYIYIFMDFFAEVFFIMRPVGSFVVGEP